MNNIIKRARPWSGHKHNHFAAKVAKRVHMQPKNMRGLQNIPVCKTQLPRERFFARVSQNSCTFDAMRQTKGPTLDKIHNLISDIPRNEQIQELAQILDKHFADGTQSFTQNGILGIYEKLIDTTVKSSKEEESHIFMLCAVIQILAKHPDNLKLNAENTRHVILQILEKTLEIDSSHKMAVLLTLLGHAWTHHTPNNCASLFAQTMALEPWHCIADRDFLIKFFTNVGQLYNREGFPKKLFDEKLGAVSKVTRALAAGENLSFLADEDIFTTDDWYQLFSLNLFKGAQGQRNFPEVYNKFIQVAGRNPGKHAKVIIENPDILASDEVSRKLKDEGFFETFFNRKVLHGNDSYRASVLELLKKRPALLGDFVNYHNTVGDPYDEQLFYRIYKLGYKKELVELVKACPDFDFNTLHPDGFPLILLACTNNDDDLVEALIAHPKFKPNTNLNALENDSKNVKNILFYLAHLLPRTDQPQKYVDSFKKVLAHDNTNLKIYNSPQEEGKGDSILMVLANNAFECTNAHDDPDPLHEHYCSLFRRTFDKVKDDEKFMGSLSNHDNKHDNIMHAVAKVGNNAANARVFTHYADSPQKILLHLIRKNQHGAFPLEYAYLSDNVDFVNRVFRMREGYRFRIDRLSAQKKFDLLKAAACGGNLALLKDLFERIPKDSRSALLLKDKFGRNLLHHAANAEIMQFVIDEMNKQNAHHLINQKDCDGSDPLLHHTVINNVKNVVKLLDNGADVNSIDDGGNTGLINAATLGLVKMVEAYTQRPQLDIDHRNNFGASALDASVSLGMMEKLLESGKMSGQLTEAYSKLGGAHKLGKKSVKDRKSLEADKVKIVGMLVDNHADVSNYKKDDTKKNASFRHAMPAMQTLIYTSLRHTSISTLNLFMMGTRENPVYSVMDTWNRSAFVFDGHQNIEKALGKLVHNLLGQALNYSVGFEHDVSFGKFYTENNMFYVKVSEKYQNHPDKAPRAPRWTYIFDQIGGALRGMFRRIGILPKISPDQIGVANISNVTRGEKFTEERIRGFIDEFKNTNKSDADKHKAKLILDSLLKDYIRLYKLKQSKFFVSGANDLMKRIKDLHTDLLHKSQININQNSLWHTDANVTNFIEVLINDSFKRSMMVQHMTNKKYVDYANLERFMQKVLNGDTQLEIDQYIAIYKFQKDVESTRQNLYDPTLISKFGPYYIRKFYCHLMSAGFAGTKYFKGIGTYRSRNGENLDLSRVMKFDNLAPSLQRELADDRRPPSFSRNNVWVKEPLISKAASAALGAGTKEELKDELGEKGTAFLTFLTQTFALITLSSRFNNALQIAAGTITATEYSLSLMSRILKGAVSTVGICGGIGLTGVAAFLYKFYQYHDNNFKLAEAVKSNEENYPILKGTMAQGLLQEQTISGNSAQSAEQSELLAKTQTAGVAFADVAGTVFTHVGGWLKSIAGTNQEQLAK